MRAESRSVAPCDSCEMLSINGVPCHETGCPRMPVTRACFECGFDFTATGRETLRRVCDDCTFAEYQED